MFCSSRLLRPVILGLLLLICLPLEASGKELATSVMDAAPRRAPVTPGAEVKVETVIESIEVEVHEVFPGDDPALLPPFPGQANLIPSISAVSRFCNRPGSLPFLTSDGCKAALSRYSQYFGRHLYYESMGDCLEFLHNQRVNRHPLVNEHNAWCDQTFANLHDRRGCYDAVPVFLGSLTEQGFCRNLPPASAQPKDTEAPYIYGYKEPGQKIDSPKTGRMPGKSIAKPQAKAQPPKAKAGQALASAKAEPASLLARDSANPSGTAQAVTNGQGAAASGQESASNASTGSPSAATGSPVVRGAISPPAVVSGPRGQAQAATVGQGAPTAPNASSVAGASSAGSKQPPVSPQPSANAQSSASAQPSANSQSPLGQQPVGQPPVVQQPVGGTAQPAAATESSGPATTGTAGNQPSGATAPIEPVTSEVPAWPAVRDFSDDVAGQEALEAASQSPLVSPGAIPPGVIATGGGQVEATGQLPPQGPQPTILPVLPPPGSEPSPTLAEPVIGTRIETEPLPPVPAIGRIAPQLMPGVPADSAVLDATLPAPDSSPVAQTPQPAPALDAFGEVIPNFIPPVLPDPLANPAQSLPQSGAPAGQAASLE